MIYRKDCNESFIIIVIISYLLLVQRYEHFLKGFGISVGLNAAVSSCTKNVKALFSQYWFCC